MTTFSNGVKPTSVHDDTIVDPKERPCKAPCYVISNIPTFEISMADAYSDEELLEAINSSINGLFFPNTLNIYSRDENIRVLGDQIKAINELSDMRNVPLDAAKAYFKNRFPDVDRDKILSFITNGTNYGKKAMLVHEVPDCWGWDNDNEVLDGVPCIPEEDIKDALTETYCKQSSGNSGSINIECIKYLAGRIESEVESAKNTDVAFDAVDNCDDCAGYQVCCDENFQAKLLPLGATISNTFSDCVYFGKDGYKDALAEYKARQQNVGYIRIGESGQGGYICSRVSKNCVTEGTVVYDDVKQCQNITVATTEPTSTPTPNP